MRAARWAAALLALSGVACGEGGTASSGQAVAETCDGGTRYGAVLTFATFARELSRGVAEGLDVDGKVSDAEDAATCYHEDYVGPDGRTGVDNQFAVLLPLIEGLVGKENIAALLDGAIANGQLLIVVRIDGVDDLRNDDCVTLRLGKGVGTPYLDANGAYVQYQTFAFDDGETPISSFPRARIEDGMLRGGPGDAYLPVRVLDANFDLFVRSSHAEIALSPEPEGGGVVLEGLVAGGIGVEDFKEIVKGLNIGSDIQRAATQLIGGIADLAPDEEGFCQQVSAGLRFRTAPAFVLDPGG